MLIQQSLYHLQMCVFKILQTQFLRNFIEIRDWHHPCCCCSEIDTVSADDDVLLTELCRVVVETIITTDSKDSQYSDGKLNHTTAHSDCVLARYPQSEQDVKCLAAVEGVLLPLLFKEATVFEFENVDESEKIYFDTHDFMF